MSVCRIKPPARCPENLLRGITFRLVRDCSTGPLFALAGLLCAWKDRSYFFELCEIELCAR
jgi:hypothetical protein